MTVCYVTTMVSAVSLVWIPSCFAWQMSNSKIQHCANKTYGPLHTERSAFPHNRIQHYVKTAKKNKANISQWSNFTLHQAHLLLLQDPSTDKWKWSEVRSSWPNVNSVWCFPELTPGRPVGKDFACLVMNIWLWLSSFLIDIDSGNKCSTADWNMTVCISQLLV